jgi:NSS family neurotransmitter:Na+ symporter
MALKVGRDRWQSRLVFILAAVGSAVGLGNLWRFPYLTYKYGGGAFLIPYLIALIVIGFPLLVLEFALGQKFQRAAVDAFANVKRGFSTVAWWALFSGFIVITYYAAVMAWALKYLFSAFTVAWKGASENYFFGDILGITESVGTLGGVQWSLFLALIAVWVAIYFCIFKGTKSVGKVVLITMPLPIILIFVLLFRAITLPGAGLGIFTYLVPNFGALFDPEVWVAAFSQIFFTLTLAFGVMVAYSSFNDRSQDIAGNAIWTAVINSAISLLSGFVVFATLGFMATSKSVGVSEVVASGPSLAFVVFPEALSMMPWAPFFSVLFFLTLLMLGIDSAFSIVEAISAALKDKFGEIKREKLSFWICLVGCVLGIIYVTGAGLYLLDIVDHFVTNISILAVGIMQCVMVGWIYGPARLRRYINRVSNVKIGKWWDYMIKYLTPAILLSLLVYQIYTEFTTPYGDYPTWALAIGWAFVIIPLLLSWLIPQSEVIIDEE